MATKTKKRRPNTERLCYGEGRLRGGVPSRNVSGAGETGKNPAVAGGKAFGESVSWGEAR